MMCAIRKDGFAYDPYGILGTKAGRGGTGADLGVPALSVCPCGGDGAQASDSVREWKAAGVSTEAGTSGVMTDAAGWVVRKRRRGRHKGGWRRRGLCGRGASGAGVVGLKAGTVKCGRGGQVHGQAASAGSGGPPDLPTGGYLCAEGAAEVEPAGRAAAGGGEEPYEDAGWGRGEWRGRWGGLPVAAARERVAPCRCPFRPGRSGDTVRGLASSSSPAQHGAGTLDILSSDLGVCGSRTDTCSDTAPSSWGAAGAPSCTCRGEAAATLPGAGPGPGVRPRPIVRPS